MEDKLEKILQEYSFKEILTKVKNFGNDPKKTEKVATHAKKAIDHMAHNLGFISTDSLKKDYKSKKVDFGMVKRSAEAQPEMSDIQAMSTGIKNRYKKGFGGEHIAKQEKENQILKDKKIRNHPAQNLEVGRERAGQAEINRRKELYSKPYKATAREDRQVDANFAKWTSKKNKPTIESIVDKYLASLDEADHKRYPEGSVAKRNAIHKAKERKRAHHGLSPSDPEGREGMPNTKTLVRDASTSGRMARAENNFRKGVTDIDAAPDLGRHYRGLSAGGAIAAQHYSPNRPKKKGDVETLTRGAVKESILEGVVSNFLEGEDQQSRARQLQRRIDSKKRKVEFAKNPGLPKAEFKKEKFAGKAWALQDMKDANIYQPGSPPPSRDKLIPFKNPSKPKPSQQDRARQLQALRKKEVVEGTNTIVANFAKVRQQLKSKQETTPSVKAFAAKLSGGSKSKLAPGSEAPNNPERVSSKIDRGIPFATQTVSRLLRGDSGEREAAASYLEKPTFQRNKMSPKEQTDMLRGAINKYVKKEESVLDEDSRRKIDRQKSISAKGIHKGLRDDHGRMTIKGDAKTASAWGRIAVSGEYPQANMPKGYARAVLDSSPNRPRKKGDIETLTRGAVKEKAIIDNFLSNLDEDRIPTPKQVRNKNTKAFLKGEIKSDGSPTAKYISKRVSSDGRFMQNRDNRRDPFGSWTKFDAEKLISKTNRPQKKGDIETLTHGGIKEKAIIDNFLSNLDEDDNTKYFARYASKAGRKYNKENSKNYESLPKYPVDGERDYEDKHIEDTKSSVDANKQKHKGEARLAALFSLMRSPNRPRKKGDIETLTRGAVKEAVVSEADHKKYKKGFEKQGAQTRATNAKMVHHGEMEPTKSKYKQGKLTPKGEYKLKQSKEREDKKYNAQHPEQVVKETVQTEDTLTGDVAIMPMPFQAVGMLKDLHKKKKKHKKGIIAAMMGAATTGS